MIGPKPAPPDEVKRRLAICESCPARLKEKSDRCPRCGCLVPVSLQRFATWKKACPINRW